jgi:uncharacterized membrane protein YdjX (TVP38/TMEM64 family)
MRIVMGLSLCAFVSSHHGRIWSIVVPVVLAAAMVCVAWRLGLFGHGGPEEVVSEAERIGGMRRLVPIFTLVYATLGALALPVSPLAYGAGAIFGIVRGAIVVWVASMLAAAAGYWLARGVLARPARALLGPYEGKLRAASAGGVALTIARIQVMPIIPFGVATYAAGVSGAPFGAFMLGTAIGIIPGTFLATVIGDRVLTGIAGSDHESRWLALTIGAALLLLSFLPPAIERMRRQRNP